MRMIRWEVRMKRIIREDLLKDISIDLKKYKIIYLEAPCGWGKTTLLCQLEEQLKKMSCSFIYNSEIERMKYTTESVIERKENMIFLVDNLGEWVISGNIDRLVEYIETADIDSRFVMAGRIPLPAQLLPYKLTSQVKIYGKEKLKFSIKEIMHICDTQSKNEKAQFEELYEISQGMPLFMTVARGYLEGV